ncbi:MAG: hypothetical protein IKA48_11645 [Fibrobacter sp.]|nr:hypothetical protein [Fibrobacter sp.]
MKKIRLSVVMLSAAMMTACTDYVAEIEDIQQERADNLNAMYENSQKNDPSELIFFSGCSCEVNRGNLVENGGQLYYNTESNFPTISYALVNCANMPDKVERLTGYYENMFIESYNVYQKEGVWWADLQLNETAQNALLGGTVSTSLLTYGDGKALAGTVQCPSVSFGYKAPVEDTAPVQNPSSVQPSLSSKIPCGDLWCGPTDTEGKVETGSDDETAGYWFEFNDANDFGTSSISYPPDVSVNEYDNFFGPLTEAYQGIKGTVMIGAGYDYPYVGLGFNLVSGDQEGTDISRWEGICLVYSSNLNFAIELQVEDEATVTEYNNYKASVARSANMTTIDYPWSKFRQEVGWGKTVVIDSVLRKTAAIKLKYQGVAGSTGDFVFYSIGRLGNCK